jgi:acetoacetate decarboxylase
MSIGYSMPSAFPLYPEPPIFYENNNMINIIFKTSTEVLQNLVPSPLLPNPDNLAFIYVGDLRIVAPQKLRYKEAGLGIPVTFKGRPGNYYVSLYLDAVSGIVGGREIWGWLKKDAEITYVVDQMMVQVSVSRDGVALITASVNATEQVKPIPIEPEIPSFNLKIVPSVKKGHAPDVLQLTSVITATKKKELSRGSATLSFKSTPFDKLGEISILEIFGGAQSVEDLNLDYGEILFDYLTETQEERVNEKA